LTGRRLATTAIFTAFVFVATIAFNASIPATNGYFDVGEIMVYTTALLFGPYVGGFAGGVGSALSDAILAPQYAPGTLVIKGLEGFIVGYLGSRSLSSVSRRTWRFLTLALGIAVASIVGYVGTAFYSSSWVISFGFPIGPGGTVAFDVPSAFWIGLALAALLGMLVLGFAVDKRVGWVALSVLAGGAEMVAGYFLFEAYGLQLSVPVASAEVPFNVAQAVLGLLVSFPIVRSARRLIPPGTGVVPGIQPRPAGGEPGS
jgi:uncharacterized membrane protein